jgi:type II secretory pathway component PulM
MNALLEKLRDQGTELWGRIQETSLYMNLREKYEGLNPRAQKGIIAGALLLAALFLFSFPYSYISSSSDSLSTFEDNRSIIRELLKASGTLREPSPLPPEIPAQELAANITRSLEEFHLVAEQVSQPQPIAEKLTNLVPDQVKQTSLSLQLKKLNLKQIVEISHRLQTLSPGTKVIGMDVHENTSSHYFDVTYRIANFSVPMPGMDDLKAPGKGGSKGKGGFAPPPPPPPGNSDSKDEG